MIATAFAAKHDMNDTDTTSQGQQTSGDSTRQVANVMSALVVVFGIGGAIVVSMGWDMALSFQERSDAARRHAAWCEATYAHGPMAVLANEIARCIESYKPCENR